MPEQFDTHNATPAFDHDSTLVVALELSGKCRAGLWLQDAAVKIGPALPGSQATRGWGIVVRSRQVPPDTSLQACGSEHSGAAQDGTGPCRFTAARAEHRANLQRLPRPTPKPTDTQMHTLDNQIPIRARPCLTLFSEAVRITAWQNFPKCRNSLQVAEANHVRGRCVWSHR